MTVTSKNKPRRPVSRADAMNAIKTLLKYLDPNPFREGLKGTPDRVLRAWEDYWGVGAWEHEPPKVTVFSDGGERYNEMLIIRGIPVYSHCEHHLAPFFGEAHVGYIPHGGKILGLSKFTRIINHYARRLQVQERLTTQIGDHLNHILQPYGCGIVIRCRHMCMESRGVERRGEETISSALYGDMQDEPETRAEFLKLIHER